MLSPCEQRPSAPKPIGVVKTGDGRGPQQAEGELLEARDDSQMTLVWDVTQTALPFNRAQANKGWRHLQSPMLFWQKRYPQAHFQAVIPSTQALEGLCPE